MIAEEKQGGFLPRVEALRGLAALCVAVFHMALITGITGGIFAYLHAYASGGTEALSFRLYMAASNGLGAVVTFFVISGFVLARSLDRSIQRNQQWLARYFISRVFRLFPATILVVGLISLIYGSFGIRPFGGSFEPINIVLNMLMLRSDIDPVMWSLTVELLATPVIFIAVLVIRTYGSRPALFAVAVMFALSFVASFDRLLGNGVKVTMLYAFLFGVLIHFHGAALARRIGPAWAVPAAIISLLIFCLYGVIPQSPWGLLLQSGAAACLITLIVWQPQLRMLKLLDVPIVRFYGRISYSFYLLHPLTMWLTETMAEPLKAIYAAGIPLVLIIIVLAIFSIALITPLAYLSWRFIELPGIALGRYLLSKRAADNLEPATGASAGNLTVR